MLDTDTDVAAIVAAADAGHADISSAHARFLRVLARADRTEVWRDAGARDTSHWIAMRYGISEWKARLWVAAAHALERLPALSAALRRGALGVNKVVELARFATEETEEGLIRWARRVSPAAVRRRADLEARRSLDEVRDAQTARTLSWWYLDEGRRFGLEAELPAAEGAVVARALERLAQDVPAMPGEEDAAYADARRADALVAMASGALARDPDPDRATVVVHARIDALSSPGGGCELEDGPAIHPETARRLLCNARVQTVVEDAAGQPVALGRMTREPPAWMLRQLRYRDRGCIFPDAAHGGSHTRTTSSVGSTPAPDGSRQPRADLRVPPPARPRARMAAAPAPRRRGDVVPLRRIAPPVRSRAPGRRPIRGRVKG